ncbi:MAG: DUF3006 domain-containing protein [Schwartzia sp.]|nr:DUF3006 domain-containing protein [Schwartzia sp. (in: firmicutes)]
MKKTRKTTAVVDRFEGENAVLLVGADERQVIFPAAALPDGLNEGDYIRMEISCDAKATKAAMEESAYLLDALRGRRP